MSRVFVFTYLVFLFLSPTSALKTININNNCPISLDIFFNLAFNGSVASKSTSSFVVDSDFGGQIYADANGGTFAGLFLPWDYYYIVRNPSSYNIGVSIVPADERPVNGFCGIASCDSANCTDGFDLQPHITEIDPVPGVPPTAPMHGCDYGTIFNITWCPSGVIPDQSTIPRAIHPMGDPSKCVDVKGNVQADGTPVQIFDCNGSGAQQWLITRGNTQVQLAGTNFCLDAGSDIGNGVGMKIWQCFTGLPQQSWFYTDDDRIAVTNHGQCLDVTNGITTNGNQLQTFQCTDNDVNQFFTA